MPGYLLAHPEVVDHLPPVLLHQHLSVLQVDAVNAIPVPLHNLAAIQMSS
jgi:hypothetical protein